MCGRKVAALEVTTVAVTLIVVQCQSGSAMGCVTVSEDAGEPKRSISCMSSQTLWQDLQTISTS